MATNDKLKARYFSHDCNARNDEKLIALRMDHGAAGYGIYFMLLERCGESTDYACVNDCKLIAFELREDPDLIRKVIEDYGLFEFTENKNRFFSHSFIRRMEFKDRDSINGIKGNLIRYDYATKEQLEKMNTDEILAFNEKVKLIKKTMKIRGDSGASSGGDRNKVKEVKENKKNKEKEREDRMPTSALYFLRENYPERYDNYLRQYKSKIEQHALFHKKFDNTVEQEGLPFNEKLFFRLENYSESWISNQKKYANPVRRLNGRA